MFANPRHDPIDGDLDLNAHRAFRQRQHLGNLTRRQPFLPIEQEYRAAAFGKVIDETSHQLFYFRFNQAAIRRICIVGGGIAVYHRDGNLFERQTSSLRLALPQVTVRFIAGDDIEIGFDVADPPQ